MASIKSCYIDSRNDQSPKCEVVHETKYTSEISCPTHTCLAQSVEHQSDDQKALGSIPTLLLYAPWGQQTSSLFLYALSLIRYASTHKG